MLCLGELFLEEARVFHNLPHEQRDCLDCIPRHPRDVLHHIHGLLLTDCRLWLLQLYIMFKAPRHDTTDNKPHYPWISWLFREIKSYNTTFHTKTLVYNTVGIPSGPECVLLREFGRNSGYKYLILWKQQFQLIVVRVIRCMRYEQMSISIIIEYCEGAPISIRLLVRWNDEMRGGAIAYCMTYHCAALRRCSIFFLVFTLELYNITWLNHA